jgi:hypothetical protein
MPPEDACPLGLVPESCAVLAGGTDARSRGRPRRERGRRRQWPGHDSGGELDSERPGHRRRGLVQRVELRLERTRFRIERIGELGLGLPIERIGLRVAWLRLERLGELRLRHSTADYLLEVRACLGKRATAKIPRNTTVAASVIREARIAPGS